MITGTKWQHIAAARAKESAKISRLLMAATQQQNEETRASLSLTGKQDGTQQTDGRLHCFEHGACEVPKHLQMQHKKRHSEAQPFYVALALAQGTGALASILAKCSTSFILLHFYLPLCLHPCHTPECCIPHGRGMTHATLVITWITTIVDIFIMSHATLVITWITTIVDHMYNVSYVVQKSRVRISKKGHS